MIISMAVSDVAESSRGLDFVFDINRLNVAVSRAQALAIIVSNETIDQGVRFMMLFPSRGDKCSLF